MKSPRHLLESVVTGVCTELWGERCLAGPFVKPCAEAKHGDFQTNAALIHGKALGQNPRELAQQVIDRLGETEIFHQPELAGPGFINFRLKKEFYERAITAAGGDARLGIPPVPEPRRIVLDFSGPNIAKEMHVGHIRSTILGDALARVHRFLGHRVLTDNHLGDWGTQFGKILLGYKKFGQAERLRSEPIEHLEELYQQIHEASKTDESIQEQARLELLKLQRGDAENLQLWQRFVDFSKAELQKIYDRLGVKFDHALGESFYNDRLHAVVTELQRMGVARLSEGAICVFFDGDAVLADKPFLIQKSDEAFLYATTDLATLVYRMEQWKVDKIIYVTDGRQQLHFQQLFAAAHLWGKRVELEHVWFGAILGEDKKPLKTREGKPIKLRALLDEAEERAWAIITEKRPELAEAQRREIARVVGLGALKYADLGQNRNLDYVFSWQKLLAFDGNTAPYLQNAYVRIQSILRKSEVADAGDGAIRLGEEIEATLAKKVLALGDVLEMVVAEQRPHLLCVYLFELATCFHKFYERCPVLKAEAEIRSSRLALCRVTAHGLRLGLELLGIEVVEEM